MQSSLLTFTAQHSLKESHLHISENIYNKVQVSVCCGESCGAEAEVSGAGGAAESTPGQGGRSGTAVTPSSHSRIDHLPASGAWSASSQQELSSVKGVSRPKEPPPTLED